MRHGRHVPTLLVWVGRMSAERDWYQRPVGEIRRVDLDGHMSRPALLLQRTRWRWLCDMHTREGVNSLQHEAPGSERQRQSQCILSREIGETDVQLVALEVEDQAHGGPQR